MPAGIDLHLLETVLVYKLPDLSREEIRTMLHLPDTDLKQTRFYREAFAEGEAQGKIQGEARGEARGKHAGELALVLRLLNRRLGAVSTRHEAAIRTLSLNHLETLGEDLMDFRDEDDLVASRYGMIAAIRSITPCFSGRSCRSLECSDRPLCAQPYGIYNSVFDAVESGSTVPAALYAPIPATAALMTTGQVGLASVRGGSRP